MSNSIKKRNDIAGLLSNISVNLAELTKKTDRFSQLKQLLPLISDLKKTEVHNKQMLDILGVVGKAISELKSNNGTTSRAVSTFSNALDRMTSQLQSQLVKLRESLMELQDSSQNMQQALKQDILNEAVCAKRQINSTIDSNSKKIKDFFNRQETELCLYSKNLEDNKYKLEMLRNRISSSKQIKDSFEQCQALFGQLRCHINHFNYRNKINSDQRKLEVSQKIIVFISQCENHFGKEVEFVIERLALLRQIKQLNRYEQQIYFLYFNWGNRLKVSLQSALIKLCSLIKQALVLNPKENIQHWQATLAKWQSLHSKIQLILK